MSHDTFERKKLLSYIFKAFNLSNVNLVIVSWPNIKKTYKGKSPYLAPCGLILDETIEFSKLIVCTNCLDTSLVGLLW